MTTDNTIVTNNTITLQQAEDLMDWMDNTSPERMAYDEGCDAGYVFGLLTGMLIGIVISTVLYCYVLGL